MPSKPVTAAEARAILAPHLARFKALVKKSDVDGEIDAETLVEPSVKVITGDHSTNTLMLPAEGPNLFVRGNLIVDGILRQEFRSGALVVFGNLRAKHIVTTAEILCLGALEVEGVLYGNCTNYSTNVLGRATVGTLISMKGHLFSLWGQRRIGRAYHDGDAENFELYDAPELAANELPPRDVLFDDKKVFELLSANDKL